MDDQKVLDRIIQYSETKDEKRYLTCSRAFQIASELNVDVSVIGRLCNQEKIKLKSCQLGCF